MYPKGNECLFHYFDHSCFTASVIVTFVGLVVIAGKGDCKILWILLSFMFHYYGSFCKILWILLSIMFYYYDSFFFSVGEIE